MIAIHPGLVSTAQAELLYRLGGWVPDQALVASLDSGLAAPQ